MKGDVDVFTSKVFTLTDEEYEEINTWAKNHKCPYRLSDGRPSRACSGGEISVTFTPTAIGTFVTATCICGAKLEIDNV